MFRKIVVQPPGWHLATKGHPEQPAVFIVSPVAPAPGHSTARTIQSTSAAFLTVLVLSWAVAYGTAKGCTAGLPIRPKAAAAIVATPEPDTFAFADPSTRGNSQTRWDWIWK